MKIKVEIRFYRKGCNYQVSLFPSLQQVKRCYSDILRSVNNPFFDFVVVKANGVVIRRSETWIYFPHSFIAFAKEVKNILHSEKLPF